MIATLLSVVLLVAVPDSLASPSGSDVLCLADGQVVMVEVVRDRTSHRTVRLAGVAFDVPHNRLGTACDDLVRLPESGGLRKVVLTDGQVLHGYPLGVAPGTYALNLLDGTRLDLPPQVVERVENVERLGPPPRTARVDRRGARSPGFQASPGAVVATQRAALSPFMGIVLVGLALLGGISFGLRRAVKPTLR